MAVKKEKMIAVKDRWRCAQCQNDKWIINRLSLEQGDKPTEAQCSKCGYTTYV